jgi:predicted ester cyclase
MTPSDLPGVYRDYIDCLNRQDWPKLEQFVDDDVRYNGRWVGVVNAQQLVGYRRQDQPSLFSGSFAIMLISNWKPWTERFRCRRTCGNPP